MNCALRRLVHTDLASRRTPRVKSNPRHSASGGVAENFSGVVVVHPPEDHYSEVPVDTRQPTVAVLPPELGGFTGKNGG